MPYTVSSSTRFTGVNTRTLDPRTLGLLENGDEYLFLFFIFLIRFHRCYYLSHINWTISSLRFFSCLFLNKFSFLLLHREHLTVSLVLFLEEIQTIHTIFFTRVRTNKCTKKRNKSDHSLGKVRRNNSCLKKYTEKGRKARWCGIKRELTCRTHTS